MSFSFGGGASGATGFSFGQPAKTTASATTPATGGFSFGTAPSQSAPAPAASGFSFGAPAAGSTGAPGFSFGNTSGIAPPTAATPSSLSLAPTTTASAPPSFGFGTMAPTTTVAPQAAGGSNFSFGGLGAPASAAPASITIAPTPAKPTSFGAPAPASTATTTTASLTLGLGTASGFSFGGPGAAAATASAAASTSSGTTVPAPTTGGFSFGSTTTTPSAVGGFSLATATSTTAAATTGGLSLGTPALTVAPTTSAPAATAPSTIPPTSSVTPQNFNLGISTASVAPSNAATTAISSSAPVALSTSTTTTSSSAAASAASMNYRQLEEGINKWTLELEEQEKVFLNQATQVNAWDRLLMENGEKIVKLHESVEKVKHDQQRLEHELDFVKSQQSELEEILQPLEASLLDAPPPDAERERIYSLAENMDAQLQRMGDDLREIIEHLNSANRSTNESDPIVQISRVLNAHMDALQWVDQTSGLVQKKLEDVNKLQIIRRKESERIGIL